MAGARRQPQGPARLARGNPLEITDLWLASSATTLVKGYVAKPTSSVSGIPGAGIGGRFVRGDGDAFASGYQISDNSNNLLGSVGTTWAIVRRCRDTVVRSNIYMHYGYDEGPNNRCLLGAPEGGNITWDFGNATAGSGRLQAPYTKDTLIETLVVVAGQVKGREIWRRGVKLAGDASAKALRNMDGVPFGIGRVGGNTPSDDVETYMVLVSNKEWSDAEIRDWSANPWSVIDAPSIRMAFPAPAGVSITASAAWTESSSTNSLQASARVNASSSWAEASDTNAIAASARLNATASWVEASDVSLAQASSRVTVSSGWFESNEVNQASGRSDVLVSAAWAESSESSIAQITIGNSVSVSANWTESTESNALAASLRASAALVWSEGSEENSAQAVIGNSASLSAAWSEASEAKALSILLRANANVGWAESGDTSALVANSGEVQDEIDAKLVPPRQTVLFEGSRRIVAFEGGKRVVSFEGSKRMVDFQ